MDQYEKSIGLKTIYTTLVRRFHIILIIFIPVAIAAFVVTNFMLTKTYSSTVTMSRGVGNTISTAQHTKMQSFIRDSSVNTEDESKSGALAIAVKNLAAQDITITTAEISAGLSFATMANGASSFSFSFISSKQAIVQPVLQAVAEAAKENMNASSDNDVKTAAIAANASAAIKNSKEQTYFLVALAADLVVACGVPFVYEIIADEVYDKEDVRNLGADSFELKVSSK